MIREKLPIDSSRSLTIKFNKDDFEFINRIYNTNPAHFRSYSGVIREAIKLYRTKKLIKSTYTIM